MRAAAVLLALFAPAALAAQAPARWRLVPEVTYGASDGTAAELIEVRDFEVARNGNVLAVDAKAHGLKLFAPSGAFLKSVGRQGQGPGEYESPNGIAMAPDGSFWVHDPRNNRLTHLDENGALLGSAPLAINSFGWTWDGAFDRQGRLVSRVLGVDKAGKSVHVMSRVFYPSGKGDSVPARGCTPPEWTRPGKQSFMSFRSRNGNGGSIMVPFAPMESQATHPEGYIWCAHGAQYAVHRIDIGSGDTLGVVRGSATPIPVARAERDSAIAELRKFAATYGEMSPDLSRVPLAHPLISAVRLDDRDRVWVQLTPHAATEARFDVLDPSGRRVATATMPGRLQFLMPMVIRGDRAYAVVEDGDGMATVVRYRIDAAR